MGSRVSSDTRSSVYLTGDNLRSDCSQLLVDVTASVVYTLDMNKTMINIKADKEVKEMAQKVAQKLGLPLSVVINNYLRQFIRNKSIYFSVEEGELKPSVKKRLDRLHKDVKEGKNLSPAFHSAKEAIRYLHSK